MIQEVSYPVFKGEHTIEALKRWPISFIGPSVQPPFEVNLLELNVIKETPKVIHHTPA